MNYCINLIFTWDILIVSLGIQASLRDDISILGTGHSICFITLVGKVVFAKEDVLFLIATVKILESINCRRKVCIMYGENMELDCRFCN